VYNCANMSYLDYLRCMDKWDSNVHIVIIIMCFKTCNNSKFCHKLIDPVLSRWGTQAAKCELQYSAVTDSISRWSSIYWSYISVPQLSRWRWNGRCCVIKPRFNVEHFIETFLFTEPRDCNGRKREPKFNCHVSNSLYSPTWTNNVRCSSSALWLVCAPCLWRYCYLLYSSVINLTDYPLRSL